MFVGDAFCVGRERLAVVGCEMIRRDQMGVGNAKLVKQPRIAAHAAEEEKLLLIGQSDNLSRKSSDVYD